jgi:hypothetical protein
MAISPGQYSFPLQRRADHELLLQFKDSLDAPIDLTGWIAYAQAWNFDRTIKYADFVVSYVNRLAGSIKIALTDTQTALLPDEVFYDVLLENPSGLREYYLEGIIYVSEGYTAP